jgi:hypothetical protein
MPVSVMIHGIMLFTPNREILLCYQHMPLIPGIVAAT